MQDSGDRRYKLPSSGDRKGRCPRCGVVATFSGRPPIYAVPPNPGHEHVLSFRCDNCDGLVAVVERVEDIESVPDPDRTKRRIAAGPHTSEAFKGEPVWSVVGSWPLGDSQPPDYVPEEVGALYREAAVCLSANCYRAAVAMTRAAIDSAVTDKGGQGKRLHDRIQSMKGTLRDQLIEDAHELKIGGNAASHDFNETWTEEEASERFILLDEVLRELYERPSRYKNLKCLGANRPSIQSSGSRS